MGARSATMRVVRRASPETEAERRRMRNTFGRRLVSSKIALPICGVVLKQSVVTVRSDLYFDDNAFNMLKSGALSIQF